MAGTPKPPRRPRHTPGSKPPRRLAGHTPTRRDVEAVEPPTTATPAADEPAIPSRTAEELPATPPPAAEEMPEPAGASSTEPIRPTGKRRPVSRVSTLKPNAGADSAAPRYQPPSREPAAASASGRVPSGRLLLGLLAAAVALTVAAVVLAFTPGAAIGDNRAYLDQAATTEVTEQAKTKICTAIAVDSVDLDEWADRARAVLTGEALEQFEDYLPTQRDLLSQTQTVADCRVDVIGVQDLNPDHDRATVVANLIISESQRGFATDSATASAQFDLVKRDGQWLISEVVA